RERVRLVSLDGAKDASALYLARGDGFPQAWKAALGDAVAWTTEAEGARRRDAAAAYQEAQELLDDPAVLDRVSEAMRAAGYAGDLRPPLLAYVALTSRLLERPLNLVFVAPSSAGKNRAVDAALALVPPDGV